MRSRQFPLTLRWGSIPSKIKTTGASTGKGACPRRQAERHSDLDLLTPRAVPFVCHASLADGSNTGEHCPGWGLLGALLQGFIPLCLSVVSCGHLQLAPIKGFSLAWQKLSCITLENRERERERLLCFSLHPPSLPLNREKVLKEDYCYEGHNELNGCYPVWKILAMSITHLRQQGTCCSVLIPYRSLALGRGTFWKEKDFCGVKRRGRFMNSRPWSKPVTSCSMGWQFSFYLCFLIAIHLIVRDFQ